MSGVCSRSQASNSNIRRFAGKEQDLNSPSTPYNRALHTFAVLVALASFLLIVVGALVTSHDAGLSVPDWPTSFGRSPASYAYFQVPLVGGVRYEHGHRMFAEFIGMLTIVLAIWTWRSDRRVWMRKLALAALGLVILQGVFGGVTVLLGLPALVSTVHAALGQSFFCVAVAIALFTGEGWVEASELEAEPRPAALSKLAWAAVAVVFVQLILGSMFRHHGMRLLPHAIWAVVVALMLLWTIIRTLSQYRDVDRLSGPATLLMGQLMLQLVLGVAAYMSRMVWNTASPAVMVLSTVAHVAVGALLLATATVLAIQATRYSGRPKALSATHGTAVA
jgi:cytochrome c oxidase assembly protein subunit 15